MLLLSSIQSRARQAAVWLNRPIVRRIAMIVAAAIFVVGLVLAIRDFPRSISDLRLTPLLLSLLVGVPATMLLLAADFVLQARFAGAKVTFRRALEITLVGNAANMLPLPAGAAVRLAAMKGYGGTFRKGAYSVAAFSALLLGIGLLYSGTWLSFGFDPWSGMVLIGAGSATLVAGCVLFFLFAAEKSARLLAIGLLIKVLQVLVSAVRIQWCFEAIGVPATHGQSAVFVVASMIGTLIWIVPGGIGIREVISAALAPMVGLAPSDGFLSATISRVLMLIAGVPIALVIVWLEARQERRAKLSITESVKGPMG